MNQKLTELSILADSGAGRTFVLITEIGNAFEQTANKLQVALAFKSRSILIQSPVITDFNWQTLTDKISQLLKQKNIKQASFVGFGGACALVQNFALTELKSVRTLVLVDACTRAHPTRWSRALDWIEHKLPLGLPFRYNHQGFDSKPFLQRLRCPILIVTSDQAEAYVVAEGQELVAHLPTAWQLQLNLDVESEKLCERLVAFQDIPAKCPQKNVAQ